MKHKVKVTAYVKTQEIRIIEITDEELAALRRGACESRIAEAFWDDEGKLDGFETVGISGESWELVEPVSAPEPAEVARHSIGGAT